MSEKQADLIDLLAVLLKRRRFLFWNSFIVSVLVLAGSFLLPVRYKATATLLLPKDSNQTLQSLSGLVQQFDLSRQLLTGSTSNAQIYLAILQSRTVADAVIDEFDLISKYESKHKEAARRKLDSLTDSKLSSSGVIEVSVQDTDPELAAQMANAYVAHLDSLNRTIRMSEGRQARIFIERRLEETSARLRGAEDSLRSFQEAHPGVVLPADAASAAGAAASFMAERIALGAELEMLRGTLSPESAALRRKQFEVQALDRELQDLPALSLEIARRYRDVKVQQTVFEFLTAQYEEARIRELKDVSTVEVLDPAISPILKSFPRRGLMTLTALLLSFVIGTVIVALQETVIQLRLQHDARLRRHVRPGSRLDRLLFGGGSEPRA